MNKSPIAVGGVGGSGTRVIAKILQNCDVFIGSDLPLSLDTVWYAALFGRRDVFLDDPEDLRALTNLFFRQMATPTALTPAELEQLHTLEHPTRIQHSPEILQTWMESFIHHCATGRPAPRWGWKVPYTHVLIDQLLEWHPDLKYIHITRNGLDMAYSQNQNQLKKWGPVFLNRDVTANPHDSLKFWCLAQKRVARIATRYPDRIYQLDFDRLVRNPAPEIDLLTQFMQVDLPSTHRAEFCSWITPPDSIGRYKNQDISVLDPQDVAFAMQSHT
ncbi:MAG: sulfotransferase [Roseovarius sp.]